MWWWVSTDILGPRSASSGFVGGLSITTEGGGYIQRRPGVYGASRLGHVTCLIFARGASCALGAGVGVEQGASGRVVGAWGVVPRMVWGVAGPGASVSRSRGWWWVPGCWGRCWEVDILYVLTL
jgi:hypothetical protein